ncbi:hypothetical protein C8_414 [Cannes 8 virus]|nr:hypothetical protein C8_414 [Cannes 8 virus]
MSKQEVVYMVRDDRLWIEGIYKVGRSSDWKQRQQSYGGARVLKVAEVSNSSSVEKTLIGKFKENFAVAKGSEYFFCSEKKACEVFDEAVPGNTDFSETRRYEEKIQKLESMLLKVISDLEEAKIRKKDESFSYGFSELLEGCDRKVIFKGPTRFLSEINKKRGNLWVFNGEEVVFNHEGEIHKEKKEDKGEFYKCYIETMEKCREECISKIRMTRDVELLKKLMYKPQEYFSFEYRDFWDHLKNLC